MQPQFTEKARTALLLAEKTASALRQGYVGTEHRSEERRVGKEC